MLCDSFRRLQAPKFCSTLFKWTKVHRQKLGLSVPRWNLWKMFFDLPGEVARQAPWKANRLKCRLVHRECLASRAPVKWLDVQVPLDRARLKRQQLLWTHCELRLWPRQEHFERERRDRDVLLQQLSKKAIFWNRWRWVGGIHQVAVALDHFGSRNAIHGCLPTVEPATRAFTKLVLKVLPSRDLQSSWNWVNRAMILTRYRWALSQDRAKKGTQCRRSKLSTKQQS